MEYNKYSAPIATIFLPCSANETLLVNQEYLSLMKDAGLSNFEDIWSFSNGEIVKQIKERLILKAAIPAIASSASIKKNNYLSNSEFYFFKKHVQRVGIFKRFLALFFGQHILSEGLKEFFYYCRFRENGLSTPVPIAAGMRFRSFLKAESFFISKNFSPFIDMEEIVLNRPEILSGEKNKVRRKNILAAIARYTRSMHEAGYNQKDFNTTHILINDLDSDQPTIALFDLQRVDTNHLNKFRWIIKALAELFYTMPKSLFSRDEKLFLFKAYKQKKQLGLIDRFQWELIKRKTLRISKHSKKHCLAPKAKSK